MVLGFVACSMAYAVPVAFQASQRLSPSFSISDSAESSTADAGRLIEQKFTNRGQSALHTTKVWPKAQGEKVLRCTAAEFVSNL